MLGVLRGSCYNYGFHDEPTAGNQAMLSRKAGILLLMLLVLGSACTSKPTAPVNRNPVITGTVVSKFDLYLGDSTLIRLIASDPDGDALVYDWYANGRFRLKDSPDGVSWFGTPWDSQLVYFVSAGGPLDSSQIFCYARDKRGGEAGVAVTLILRDTSTAH